MRSKIALFFAFSLFLGASSQAQETVAELKQKIIEIQNKGTLGIKDFNYCSAIASYASYTPIPGNQAKARSTMLFYFEPSNLSTNYLNNVYQVNFSQDIIVLDAKGATVMSKPDAFKMNYQTRAPVMDFFVTNSLNTGNMPKGKYVYKVVLHDLVKKKDASYSYNFEIVP